MDRTVLEEMLGEGLSLAEIGRRFDRHESTVAYWVAKHGLEAGGRGRHGARGTPDRDVLERFVADGASIGEITTSLERSKGTVRYWLRTYGLKTAQEAGKRRSRGAQAAADAGLTRAIIDCPTHGPAAFVVDGRGYYRCTRCRSAAVTKRRRMVKATLVREFGGACQICGYSRCIAALQFHHVTPAEKAFALSRRGVSRSLASARLEASKCVLLCGNCHAEVEAGFVSLDLSVQPE